MGNSMALDISIDTSSLLRTARRYENGESILVEEISKTMNQSVNVFEQLVAEETPVGATGAARGSVTKEIFGQPLSDNYMGVVLSSIIYGQPLEISRDPGWMPPVDAIELWVRRVMGISGQEARSVAWAVATNIKKFGTYRNKSPKGARMFAKGFARGKPVVDELWRELPARVIKLIWWGA